MAEFCFVDSSIIGIGAFWLDYKFSLIKMFVLIHKIGFMQGEELRNTEPGVPLECVVGAIPDDNSCGTLEMWKWHCSSFLPHHCRHDSLNVLLQKNSTFCRNRINRRDFEYLQLHLEKAVFPFTGL